VGKRHGKQELVRWCFTFLCVCTGKIVGYIRGWGGGGKIGEARGVKAGGGRGTVWGECTTPEGETGSKNCQDDSPKKKTTGGKEQELRRPGLREGFTLWGVWQVSNRVKGGERQRPFIKKKNGDVPDRPSWPMGIKKRII